MSFINGYFLYLLIPLSIYLYKIDDITKRVYISIIMLITLSLSNPSISNSIKEGKVSSRDLMIALDVSASMGADDIYPSRYEYAKEVISHLLRLNPKDNITLLVFTTNPLLLSPPTTDHKLIQIALDSFNIKYVLTKGTSIKNLFAKLNEIGDIDKNIILFTDGGEESDLSSIRYNSNLIVVGLATIEGTTIKNDKGVIEDREGNIIISRLNPNLKSLSSNFITPSSSPLLTAKEITSMFDSHKNMIEKRRKSYTTLYQIPLLLAFLLFMIINTTAKKYLILLLLFFGVAKASIFDGYYLTNAYNSYYKRDFKSSKDYISRIDEVNLQSQMLLASIYYKSKNFKKARNIYLSIKSTSSEIKSQIYFNIANTYAMSGKYKMAREYYLKSLYLKEDNEAIYNLNLILKLVDRKKENGLSAPKSKSNSSSQNKTEDNEKENKNKSNSSSGGGGGTKQKSKDKNQKLKSTKSKKRVPIGSKVYELINRGYINETKPY